MISYHLADPYWLILLTVLPLMVWFYRRRRARIFYSKAYMLEGIGRNFKTYPQHLGIGLRLCALGLTILALSRPQSGSEQSKQRTEGLDMMLVVDTSGSMRGLDFVISGKRYDRLYVAKSVLKEFIQKRIDDRLGLCIFGTHAFAYVPLTLDHDVLLRYLDEVEIGMAGDSTAIGDAIGVATNRLKDLAIKSKVMILLTDGSNQAGKIDPLEAAKAAKVMGVKIYSIGVGSNGPVPIPTQFGYQNVRIELDENLLKEVASMTGGQYFRATDTKSLADIYKTIDKLEKTEREVVVFRLYEERFAPLIWLALVCLVLELFFGLSRWRRIP